MQQKTVFADPDKEIAFQNICLQVVCNCCAECRKSLCDKGFGILGKDEVASSNLAISSTALAEMQVLFLVLWTE